MNNADVGDAWPFFEVVCDDTLCNDFAFKLPVKHLVISIYVKLNGPQRSFGCWLTYSSPRCGLLVLAALCVMDLSVGKVEAKSFFTDFVFDRNILLRHYTDFDTVDV